MNSKVIQPAARRAGESSPQPTVNNFGAKNDLPLGITKPGRNATSRSRSNLTHATSVGFGTPVGSCRLAPRSERTTPHEGHDIGWTQRRQSERQPKTMKTYAELTHFAGFDWAKDHHQVLIVDGQAQPVDRFTFLHNAEGWQQWQQCVEKYPALGVAVETSSGLVVERLVESGATVFPVNPKSAKAYRQRKAPSGTKTDQLDAWSLADALRTDGHGWRALTPLDPLLQELRLLCRDEVELIRQRTALVNQLQAALAEYYPAALSAFNDWTAEYAWEFIKAFPTPELLLKAGSRRWQNFLHKHRLYRPQTVQERLDIFAKATEFAGSLAVTRAKSRLALSLAATLLALQKQLEQYRLAIAELFARHPDHDLFGSLPGAGEKLAPRLLSEIGQDRSRFDLEGLCCVAGTAPVSFQSGQMRYARIRWHCNKHLRYVVHLWADCSRKYCAWSQTFYAAHRARGASHASALRRLGQRWLKILWTMWQQRQPYDGERHARDQQAHGSWLLQLNPAKT
jgi:transposase